MTRRLPWILLAAGMVLKAALLALYHVTSTGRYLVLAVGWDPLAVRLTDATVGLFFRAGYAAPGNLEYGLWLVLLVLFFGLECFAVGSLVARVARLARPRRAQGR